MSSSRTRIRSPATKTCAGCKTMITDRQFITCNAGKCDNSFHLLCLNITTVLPEQRATWICPDCQAATKKGGDNSLTPVRQSNKCLENAQLDGDVTTLTSEIRLLRQDMWSLKNELRDVVSSLKECHSRLDGVTSKISEMETRMKSLEVQQAENKELKATILQLESDLNIQSQSALKNEVEIIGIAEDKNENVHQLVQLTAAKLGIALMDLDIDNISRAGPRRPEVLQHSRPIVVRFTRRAKRDEFICGECQYKL